MADSPERPVIVLIAIVAAALMSALSVASAFLNNPVIALPHAIIAFLAMLGLIRGKRWAGYGFGLFLACSTAAGVYATYRIGTLENAYVLIGAIIPLAIGGFAFLAGQALAAQPGKPSGSPLPWIAISAVPLALSLFFNLMFMPTASMEPTLLTGDNLVVRRMGPSALRRGDLVVYREPVKQNIFVKRIVAVGGDRLHLDRKTLYLNGRPVDEPYALHNTDYVDQYRDNFPMGELVTPLAQTMQQELLHQVHDGDFVVPSGTFFVLGDNRDNSLDSRYSGVIPAAAVIGKPLLVCFSAEPVPQQAPHNVLARARWNRILKPL
jgi:signal peptidase I